MPFIPYEDGSYKVIFMKIHYTINSNNKKIKNKESLYVMLHLQFTRKMAVNKWRRGGVVDLKQKKKIELWLL